jgi:hypothetical protein
MHGQRTAEWTSNTRRDNQNPLDWGLKKESHGSMNHGFFVAAQRLAPERPIDLLTIRL